MKRKELSYLRDMAFRAADGDESAMQYLYPMYGSLSRDEARGIGIAFGTWLINLKEDN